jgi:ParB-like nuclease domain
MKAHSIADLFPMLEGDDLQALANDIRENGLHEPILVFEGEIIDGRNRYAACQLAGVEPRIADYKGLRSDIPARIISMNLQRRHLTTEQRAHIAAEIANMGRGGHRGNQYTGGKGSNDPLPHDPRSEPAPISINSAAKQLQVSPASVKRAKAIMRSDPEAHKAAMSGARRRLRKHLGKARAEAFERRHAELAEPRRKGPLMHLIDSAIEILNTMGKVAKAAEKGDEAALRQIVDGAKLVTDLMVRLGKFADEEATDDQQMVPAEAQGEACNSDAQPQANGEDRSATPTSEPEQRISPRTGKPVRKYTKRNAEAAGDWP